MSSHERGSPLRKRARLSSPQYDEQVDAMDLDDFSVFDELESTHSHRTSSQRDPKLLFSPKRTNGTAARERKPALKALPSERPRSTASQAERDKRVKEMEEALRDDVKENQRSRRKAPASGPASSPGQPIQHDPLPPQRTRSFSNKNTIPRQPREDNGADNPFKQHPLAGPSSFMPASQSGFASSSSHASFAPASQNGFGPARFAAASQSGFASASQAGLRSFVPLAQIPKKHAPAETTSLQSKAHSPTPSPRTEEEEQEPEHDYDVWFDSVPPLPAAGAALPAGFSSARVGFSKAGTGFVSASTARGAPAADNGKGKGRAMDYEEEEDSEPPEPDYSAWFDSGLSASTTGGDGGLGRTGTVLGFASAAVGFKRPSVTFAGFSTANASKAFVPSAAALKAAEENMKRIEAEVAAAIASGEPAKSPGTSRSLLTTSSARAAENATSTTLSPFSSALNALAPETPTPAGFARPKVIQMGSGNKQFKSPLMVKPTNMYKTALLNFPVAGSPLNPARTRNPHPLAGSPIVPSSSAMTQPQFSTPRRAFAPPTSSFLTPRTPITPTQSQRKRPSTPQFKTPFKAGMQPGESGRATLAEMKANQLKAQQAERMRLQAMVAGASGTPVVVKPSRRKFFDLAPPAERKTLLQSGLVPQSFDTGDLEAMGIDAAELCQITPMTALYYAFNSTSRVPPPVKDDKELVGHLGPDAALRELQEMGCEYVTKPWVDNHWALILWKLAGMIALDRDTESDPLRKRWCWAEVMRQMLYRYERELNGGSRPPLRQIAAQDSPASAPMILCVSEINWSDMTIGDDGLPVEPHPELQLTDGWYRMRAEVDVSMAKAVRRGTIRLGRKIAVAGCKLDTERKDASEILEAYNSIKLVVSGNSSHLAPWHAKLGFMATTPVATLNSLTAHGGAVALMDVIVVKLYPIAYLEFIEEDGVKSRIGPRNANEEAQVDEQWKQKREIAESKLRAVFEKKAERFDGYAERLEEKAGSRFKPGEDDNPPNNLDNLYEDLEDPSQAGKVIARLNSAQSGWFARFIKEQLEKDRERHSEEMEQELATACPPRNVRNFRVLVVEDAVTCRKPSLRNAQLTVWDALALSMSEGGDGGQFAVGERYKVTNVVPTQQSAWMDCNVGSEVFLSTRRDSRWTKVKF